MRRTSRTELLRIACPSNESPGLEEGTPQKASQHDREDPEPGMTLSTT